MVLLLAVAGCTSTADQPPEAGRRSTGERSADGCGPPRFAQVDGRVPAYLDRELDPFPNDRALCAGLWLPRVGADFVPQGLAVDGTEALVSGYDDGPVGSRFCRVLRVDLRSGRLLDEMSPVEGSVGGRAPVACRHGGGLLLDGHGLWLVETTRLWLLEPATLAVERVWGLDDDVRGSFAVHDDRGRLGIGGFRQHRRAQLLWFDPASVLASPEPDLTEIDAVESQPVPKRAQGAVWLDRGDGAGVWFATSTSYCGVLVGPQGARRGFLPGAEGLSRGAQGGLWALSESASRSYQLAGGRPVVPMLARFDVSRMGAWERPDCQP